MSAPAVADSLIGLKLADKYRVLQQIGRGGMGVVYEAEHVGLGKRVAIKLMLEKYSDDTEARSRFHREALAAGKIGNPHIIEIFDIGTAPDGRSFVVMELLNGFPLSKVLEMGGAMPPWRAVQIMKQVLRAVGAAHAKGIIHRDLKPDNIFLISQSEDHDFVKLLDFGISKVISLEEHVQFTKLTSTGVVMGTPLYMAPEQAMGSPIERHADIYACGVILYEMLAGRPPFEGPTYAALVSKVLTQPPPPLDEVRAGLPSAIVRAVHRALEKEPGDRFGTAEQFAAALPSLSAQSNMGLVGTLGNGQVATASPPGRPGRLRNVAIAAIAFTLAAAATAVVLVVTDDNAPAQPTPAPQGSADPSRPPQPPEVKPPAATTGTLEVKSNPPGATVTIDGAYRGTTPVVVTLDPGKHQIRLELAGYASLTAEEEIRANKDGSAMYALAAASAKPQGAPVSPSAGGAKTVKRPPPGGGASAAKTPPQQQPPPPDPHDPPRPPLETPPTKPPPADLPKPPADGAKVKPPPGDPAKPGSGAAKPNPYQR